MKPETLWVESILQEYERKAARIAACPHDWQPIMSSVRNGWQFTELRGCTKCGKTEVVRR